MCTPERVDGAYAPWNPHYPGARNITGRGPRAPTVPGPPSAPFTPSPAHPGPGPDSSTCPPPHVG